MLVLDYYDNNSEDRPQYLPDDKHFMELKESSSIQKCR